MRLKGCKEVFTAFMTDVVVVALKYKRAKISICVSSPSLLCAVTAALRNPLDCTLKGKSLMSLRLTCLCPFILFYFFQLSDFLEDIILGSCNISVYYSELLLSF